MMKTLKWFGSVLLAMVMAFGMVACGGDDENDNGGGSGATGWEGDWLIMATSDFVNYPAYIQVLTLDRATGRFYSTYYFTEDGEFVGGSIAYGSLTVNEQNSTMTINGVTGEYEVDGDEITFFTGYNTSYSYRRLNAEQRAIFAKWAEMAKGYVYPYEIEPGSGFVIPGGGGTPGGGGSGIGGDVLGSWYEEFSDSGLSGYDIYTFKSDGMLENEEVFTSDGRNWYKMSFDSMWYKINGNKMTITGSSGSSTSTYSVVGNTLIIGDEVALQKMTSNVQKIWNSAQPYY